MKDKIVNVLKAFLLTFPATIGLVFMYSVAWFSIGLPEGWWATAILAVIAGVSEYAIIMWIAKN